MLLSHQEPVTSNGSLTGDIQLRCLRCARPMGALGHTMEARSCSGCTATMANQRGVWKALSGEREMYFSRFVEDYQVIRAAEGRGSSSAAYYLGLPYRDHSGRNRAQWAIRARSYRYMERHILPRIATVARPRLRILDLGAGNGWLSYRLARQGHSPVAVDLITNNQDGLGAAEHYRQALPELFPRFQAEADNLPFADAQFDFTVFNASLHYSEDYEKTMAEALRCTRPGGTVLVADTPWYSDEQSGVLMLEERRALFIKRYGFPSDHLSSLEYLTDERLARMEAILGIRWRVHRPYYGLRWQLRPFLAKIRHKRPPSQFRIYVAEAQP